MSGGMFDGLRNAEKVLAQPKKEKKKPEPEEESMDDFDFSKLGGGTDWADADEQMPVMDEPEPEGLSQSPTRFVTAAQALHLYPSVGTQHSEAPPPRPTFLPTAPPPTTWQEEAVDTLQLLEEEEGD